jgi:hypothetical protein
MRSGDQFCVYVCDRFVVSNLLSAVVSDECACPVSKDMGDAGRGIWACPTAQQMGERPRCPVSAVA